VSKLKPTKSGTGKSRFLQNAGRLAAIENGSRKPSATSFCRLACERPRSKERVPNVDRQLTSGSPVNQRVREFETVWFGVRSKPWGLRSDPEISVSKSRVSDVRLNCRKLLQEWR
jgi:hypothetical protein